LDAGNFGRKVGGEDCTSPRFQCIFLHDLESCLCHKKPPSKRLKSSSPHYKNAVRGEKGRMFSMGLEGRQTFMQDYQEI
jgi:hypothetical protein